MTKEEIIDELSKNERLTKEAIASYIGGKRTDRTRGIVGAISEASEKLEVVQKIVRAERIKTRVRKVSTIGKSQEENSGISTQ